jgi:predicted component of type VI protein secretion system
MIIVHTHYEEVAVPPFLITQRGPEIGRRDELTDAQLTIGRDPDNNLVLLDALVSRYHAVIRRDGDDVVVIDLGSTNPVAVNDTVLEPGVPCPLQHRDVVSIGQNVFSFQNPSGTQRPISAPSSSGPRTMVGGVERPLNEGLAAAPAATPPSPPLSPESPEVAAGSPGGVGSPPISAPAAEPPTVVRRPPDARSASAPAAPVPESIAPEEKPTVIVRRPSHTPETVPPPAAEEPPTRTPGSFSES